MACCSKRAQNVTQAHKHDRHADDKGAAHFQFFLLHTVTPFSFFIVGRLHNPAHHNVSPFGAPTQRPFLFPPAVHLGRLFSCQSIGRTRLDGLTPSTFASL